MRIATAVVIGLGLPMLLSVVIVQAAADDASAQYLHAERVAAPAEGIPLLKAAQIAVLPEALQRAVYAAARDGSAELGLDVRLRAAWAEVRAIAGGASRVMFEAEGALVAMEVRETAGLVEQASRAAQDLVGGAVATISKSFRNGAEG